MSNYQSINLKVFIIFTFQPLYRRCIRRKNVSLSSTILLDISNFFDHFAIISQLFRLKNDLSDTKEQKKNKTRVNKESAQVFISALFGTMCVCIWRCPNCMWARCYVAHPHASLDVSVWKYFTATIWRLHRVRWRENTN